MRVPILRAYEDHRERYEAAVERFKLGEIREEDFRMLLAALGFSATDIEIEVQEAQEG